MNNNHQLAQDPQGIPHSHFQSTSHTLLFESHNLREFANLDPYLLQNTFLSKTFVKKKRHLTGQRKRENL